VVWRGRLGRFRVFLFSCIQIRWSSYSKRRGGVVVNTLLYGDMLITRLGRCGSLIGMAFLKGGSAPERKPYLGVDPNTA
jgi:hypothetical protein